ncbi:hypothetical protein DI44_12805 [Geobacillus sp. CAMR5420]|nr:hypothetical protein DI44_12805 [Geobacillus sp. CAMR5420]
MILVELERLGEDKLKEAIENVEDTNIELWVKVDRILERVRNIIETENRFIELQRMFTPKQIN